MLLKDILTFKLPEKKENGFCTFCNPKGQPSSLNQIVSGILWDFLVNDDIRCTSCHFTPLKNHGRLKETVIILTTVEPAITLMLDLPQCLFL